MRINLKQGSIGFLANQNGEYSLLRDSIALSEYENTLDEGWTLSETFEGEKFRELSEEGKRIYALQHSLSFADNTMKLSPTDFEKLFDDQYSEIIEAWMITKATCPCDRTDKK